MKLPLVNIPKTRTTTNDDLNNLSKTLNKKATVKRSGGNSLKDKLFKSSFVVVLVFGIFTNGNFIYLK